MAVRLAAMAKDRETYFPFATCRALRAYQSVSGSPQRKVLLGRPNHWTERSSITGERTTPHPAARWRPTTVSSRAWSGWARA